MCALWMGMRNSGSSPERQREPREVIGSWGRANRNRESARDEKRKGEVKISRDLFLDEPSLPPLGMEGRRASLRRTISRRGRVTTRVPRESASGTRWLCISLALNIAEAKVVPASLYGPFPPTTSRRLSLPFHSVPTYLRHYDILPFVLSLRFSIQTTYFRNSFTLNFLFTPQIMFHVLS